MAKKGGFLVTDADGTQHLPTELDGKVDRGLCGDAWAALHKGFRGKVYQGADKGKAITKLTAIYKAQGWDLPGDASMSASFAVDDKARAPDGMVYRTGLIFKAGDYPNPPQKINVSESDIAAMAAAFSGPLDAELEHVNSTGVKTFLDGHLGQLVAVWADGPNLFGRMAVPEWMDPLWAEFGRKVSVVLSRTTKQLRRIGLVLDPQVEEAAVMSKYAAFAASSPEEASDLEAVARFLGNRHSKADMKQLNAIHDTVAALGADCPGNGTASMAANQGADCAPAGMSNPDSLDRGLLDGTRPKYRAGGQSMASKFGHWFKQGRESREIARDAGAELPEETIFSTLEDEAALARQQAHDDQVAKMSAQLAEAAEKNKLAEAALFAANAQRIQGEAAAFVDGLIVGGKLYPAEREGAIALYAQAGMDDATSGAVTFANGATGSRVEQFKKSYESRPAHGLTQEQLEAQVKDGVAFGLLPGGKDKESAEQRQERILSLTPQGRAHLAQRRKEKQA